MNDRVQIMSRQTFLARELHLAGQTLILGLLAHPLVRFHVAVQTLLEEKLFRAERTRVHFILKRKLMSLVVDSCVANQQPACL